MLGPNPDSMNTNQCKGYILQRQLWISNQSQSKTMAAALTLTNFPVSSQLRIFFNCTLKSTAPHWLLPVRRFIFVKDHIFTVPQNYVSVISKFYETLLRSFSFSVLPLHQHQVEICRRRRWVICRQWLVTNSVRERVANTNFAKFLTAAARWLACSCTEKLNKNHFLKTFK